MALTAACSSDDETAARADAGSTSSGSSGASSSSSGAIDAGASSSGGGSSGNGSSSGDAALDVLTSGDGYALAYFSGDGIGIDARFGATATFDESGAMTGYRASDQEFLNLGAAANQDTGADALASWGSWFGGPTAGKFYAAKPNGDFTFASGFHYAIGKGVAVLPTSGTTTFGLLGATPAHNGAANGNVTEATLVFDFATRSGSFTLRGTIDGSAIDATTTVQAAAGDDSRNYFYANGVPLDVRGVLLGDGTRFGIAYRQNELPSTFGALMLRRQP